MGSTDPQKSEPTIPGQLAPFVSQTGQMINNLKVPDVTQMTGANQAAMALGEGQLAPGGGVQGANNQWSNIVSGNYLNPSTNPYMQNVMDSSLAQFHRAMGTGLDQVFSRFNMGGHNPGGSAMAGAAGNFARNTTADYTNNMNNMLFGQYNTGMQQMIQAMQQNSPMNLLQQAMPYANLPQTLDLQQFGLNQIPIQLMMQFLQSVPMQRTMYGPSEFQNNFGMGMQGLQAAAGAYKAYNAPGAQ